jgi:serine/threonine-protein kinase
MMPLGVSNEEQSAAPKPEDRIGQVIDRRYIVESILGMGGLGVVYRARHDKLDRPVAIKLMHPELASHAELRRRFDREARALSTLVHPNIVAISDFGNHEGTPFLVMELLEGEPLSQRLERLGPPPIDDVVEILRQVVVALKAAHDQGVLHRDLKPGNIMLRKLPNAPIHAVIVDFGLAKIADPAGDGPPDPTLTKLGTIIGTPSYMSPEQVATEVADERADIYALGIVLFEMLTGRPPFVDDDNKMNVLRAHLATALPDPESLREGLSLTKELRALLYGALEKDRDERVSSAAALLALVTSLPTPAATAPDAPWLAPAPNSALLGSAPTVPIDSATPAIVGPPTTPKETKARRLAPALGALFFGVVVAVALVSATFLFGDDSETLDAEGDAEVGEDGDGDGDGDGRPSETRPSNEPRPPAVDPLARGAPRALRRHHRRVRRGVSLTRDEQREIRTYQREHMDDPRPSLILGHDHYAQQWYGDALERYRIVDVINPAARGNAWLRDDLISMAATASHGEPAAALFSAIYGREAIAFVERRLTEDEALDEAARARLTALIERLRRAS